MGFVNGLYQGDPVCGPNLTAEPALYRRLGWGLSKVCRGLYLPRKDVVFSSFFSIKSCDFPIRGSIFSPESLYGLGIESLEICLHFYGQNSVILLDNEVNFLPGLCSPEADGFPAKLFHQLAKDVCFKNGSEDSMLEIFEPEQRLQATVVEEDFWIFADFYAWALAIGGD